MILHPAVIALLTGSRLVSLMIVYAAFWGYRIVEGWELQSDSERQLALEKKTYLVSILMTYAFGFQVDRQNSNDQTPYFPSFVSNRSRPG